MTAGCTLDRYPGPKLSHDCHLGLTPGTFLIPIRSLPCSLVSGSACGAAVRLREYLFRVATDSPVVVPRLNSLHRAPLPPSSFLLPGSPSLLTLTGVIFSMRLLDTSTGFFREFTGPEDPELAKCGGYIILSHTWNRKEDSYQDLLRLQARAKERAASVYTRAMRSPPDESNTHDRTSDTEGLASEWAKMCKLWRAINHGSPAPSDSSIRCLSILDDPELSKKIKGLCKTARERGYRYVWDDTCCIDKTSSAELSQAINSMYEWYRLAKYCYVYLADVPDGDDPRMPDSAFARSRWHKRGWTLQELVADPVATYVKFYSSTWTYIGNRQDLADVLERVTGIDARVLTGKESVYTIPVARRMWWASKRETTRVEDEAYCLLGLFGIHMSPIYGEGQNAFVRLQRKIMKAVPDQTIFAWGLPGEIRSPDDYRLAPSSSPHLLRPSEDGFPSNSSLLALSPRDFRYSGGLVPLSMVQFLDRLEWKPEDSDLPLRTLQYTFAADGVHVSFPCVDLSAIPELHETLRRVQQTLPPSTAISESGRHTRCNAAHCNIGSLALLLCQAPGNRLVALLLRSPSSTANAGLEVGLHCDKCLESDVQNSRTVYLSDPVIQAMAKLIRAPTGICIRQGKAEEPPLRDASGLTRYDSVEDYYDIMHIEGEYQPCTAQTGCLATHRYCTCRLQNQQTRDPFRGNLCYEVCWSASLVPAHPPIGATFSVEHSERIDISVHALTPYETTFVVNPESDAWHRARITVSNYTRYRAVASPREVPAAMAPGEGSTVTSNACASKDADESSESSELQTSGVESGATESNEPSCERQSFDVLLDKQGRFHCAFHLRLAEDPGHNADDVKNTASLVGSAPAQEQELADLDGFSLWTLNVSSTLRRVSTYSHNLSYVCADLVLKLELSPAAQAPHAAQ